jgi:uncharacterized protein (TIGR03437 family)
VLSSDNFYKVTVPPGATSLTVATSGGTGDVDLFVKYGRPAVGSGSSYTYEPLYYDKYSAADGNAESVTFSSPVAGDYYIDLNGYASYSGVTLTATVVGQPSLTAAPSPLTFSAVAAGAAPAAQTLTISDPSGSAFAWTAVPATSSGGNWLTISKTSGTGNTSLQVTVNQTGLAAATYQGTIAVTAASLAGSPMTIPVTLTVTSQTSQPALGVATTPIAFQAVSGQNPAAQNLAISNTGGGTLTWTAAPNSGATWLKVSPASGTGNATIQVSVVAASLALGSYSGTITITAAGASSSPVVVQVSLTVTSGGAPAISTGGVVGGAVSLPPVVTISPGGFATVFGTSFAPAGTARSVQAGDVVNGNLPTNLAGTCVQVDGKAAFLTYVSPTQINFQVPTITLNTNVNVVVVANCGASNEARSPTASVPSAAASPEFLYWVKNANGKDPVIAVNAVTGAYVGASGLIPGLTFAPAKPGDILTIYGVSFGPTTPSFAPGSAPATTGYTTSVPGVTMGSVTLGQADVLYAGVSPGNTGLYQLNIRVPANLPDGDQPLTLTLGSYKTPSVGFVTVQANPTPPGSGTYNITTFAGSGATGYSGDGGSATQAALGGLVQGTAFDAAGNFYLAVWTIDKIRKVSTNGAISLVAGSTEGYGGDGGQATAAKLYWPFGVAVSSTGIVYIADSYNHRIRRIALDGTITTVAGTGQEGFSGDGGPAVNALLDTPYDVKIDDQGNLIVSDSFNYRIRKITPSGTITTLAQLSVLPEDIALDHSGNIYVAGGLFNTILKVNSSGVVTTIAGTGGTGSSGDGGPATAATLNWPEGVAVDNAGNVFVADTNNSRVRRITPAGIISTIAGTGVQGYNGDGGLGSAAQLNQPEGVSVGPDGSVYVADSFNYRIRKLTPVN